MIGPIISDERLSWPVNGLRSIIKEIFIISLRPLATLDFSRTACAANV